MAVAIFSFIACQAGVTTALNADWLPDTSFQFLSQPDGLRSSTCPRLAGLVTVFDSDLPPPKRASTAPLPITAGLIAQP
jgi:hypothetical protein